MTARTKRPRKQSSPRMSTLAGRIMRLADDAWVLGCRHAVIPVEDLRALAGSVLSQDERKGQR